MAWFQLIRKQGNRSTIKETLKIFCPGFTLYIYIYIYLFIYVSKWKLFSELILRDLSFIYKTNTEIVSVVLLLLIAHGPSPLKLI